ncbi:hypothetical protein [Fischerella muscicola]
MNPYLEHPELFPGQR